MGISRLCQQSMTITAISTWRRPSTMCPSWHSYMPRILKNCGLHAKCFYSFTKRPRTFTAILRPDPTEGDGRHIELRRARDGSVTLKEILRHNQLRSLVGIGAPMLLAALFDAAKVRVAMAVTTTGPAKQIHLDGLQADH